MFMGVSTQLARRAIRKLRDLQCLRVWVPQMAGQNFVTLDRVGAHLLEVKLGLRGDRLRTPKGIGRVQLAHHGQVVDLHLALALACARSRSFELIRFDHEAEIRRATGAGPGSRVPDGIALLNTPAGRQAIAVESDSGAENPSRTARSKGEGYAELSQQGVPLAGAAEWKVVLLAPSIRRRNRVARAFFEAELPEGLFLFLSMTELDPRTVLEPLWWTQRSDEESTRLEQVPLVEPVTPTCNTGHYRQEERFPCDSEQLHSGPPGCLTPGSGDA